MGDGLYLMESAAMILSTALDLYLIYCLTAFLDGRDRYKRDFFVWSWVLSSAVCMNLFKESLFYGVMYVGSLVILTYLRKQKEVFKSLIYLSNCMLVVGMTKLIITCALTFLFSETKYAFDTAVQKSIAGILCFFIYFSLLRVAKYYMPGMEMRLSFYLMVYAEVMLGVNMFILLYALHFIESIADKEEKRQISIVFSFVSLGMVLELILVILSVVGIYFYRKMLDYKDSLIQAQLVHAEYIKQSNYGLRKIRHDSRAHYNVISYLLEKEEYENAQAYVQELSSHLKLVGKYCDTGSMIVDALVSEKMVAAKENEIAFSFCGRLPERCKMLETEQCILFSNLLNNAFEAVMKVEGQPRKVEILVRTYEDELLIRASNTYNGKLVHKNGVIVTDKEDRDEHGFGLRNIQEIVEKYGGNVEVREEEGRFVVMVRV